MSDEAHSGANDGPQKVYGWRYQNGATIQREAEFTAGDDVLTPNDPRWQESLPTMPPEWLPSGWEGEGDWPDRKPATFSDIDAWLVERQRSWRRWAVVAMRTT